MAGINQAAQTRDLVLDWGLNLTQPAAVLGRDYWESRRPGRAMPSRRDLDAVAMRKFTEHVGLIEVRSEPGLPIEYFIRRAGSKWEAVYGPITGRFIHEFLPPEVEVRWRKVFDAVRIAKAPVRVTSGIQFQGKSWLEAEMFVAPLGEQEVTMLFMTFVSWSRSSS